MAYSKLHASIVGSSLWTEPDTVRILFITLLALCDRDGIVYGTKLGLNRLANIDLDEADSAWDALLSPDDNSSDKMRAPENEGRRIEEVPGGFKLLNFEYYRALRNDDDRREQNRIAQARFKQKVSRDKPESAKVSRGQPKKAEVIPSEAEAEAEVHILSGKRGYHADSRAVLHVLNESSGKHYRETDANLSIISARLNEPEVNLDGVKEMIVRQSKLWKGNEMDKYLRPETLFGKSKFDGYYAQRKDDFNSPQNGVNPTTLAILRQKELDEVVSRMRSIRGSYSEHLDWAEEDKTKWHKLKARKDELKKLLGMQV
jgi:uncharacterized phage protein (TIGR02220 family)